jgi:uncharacterized protein YkwD
LRSNRCVLAGLLAGLFALPAPVAPAAASPESEMVLEVNRIRDRYGEPPLSRSISLGESSGRFARWLMRRGRFAHRASIGVASRFAEAGETLSLHDGWRPGARHTVQRWMQSPGHRAVLLSEQFRWIGVGRSQGEFGGRRATIWVAHLAN